MIKQHKDIGYELITREIAPGSRVLDLGCGEGDLLYKLVNEKNIKAFGVEISREGVSKCVEKGLFVSHGDIDEGLSDYKSNSFDYVILNQTLQNTKKPSYVLKEIMRIGKFAIISFPNFGYYKIRYHLLFQGTMPKTSALPFNWHESPNIHLTTIKDFKRFCLERDFQIEKELNFCQKNIYKSVVKRLFPNYNATYGLFILKGN